MNSAPGVSESPVTEKPSITVPKGLTAQIRERVGRGNVSAYVTRVLLSQLEHDRLGDLVADCRSPGHGKQRLRSAVSPSKLTCPGLAPNLATSHRIDVTSTRP
jgi:hypothetical protein